MKKTLFICICTLSLLVCNIQTVFGAVGDNVTVTDYGSYTINSSVSTSTTTYTIGNVTVQGPSVGFIYVYEYQLYHYYQGQIRFVFNQDISGCDWYIEGNGAVFQSSYSGTYITVGLNGCNSFKLTVIRKNSNSSISLSNTQYITMTNVDDTTDVSTILNTIDGHINDVEGFLSTISSNLNTIKGLIDGLEGNTDGVESSLNSLINSVNSLVSNTDQLEGYTDNIESYLNTIAINTGVQNGLSLIGGISQLIGMLSSSVANAPSIFDITHDLLETANNIKGLFDSADVDNSEVVSAINDLLLVANNSLSYVPTYSLTAYQWWLGFNCSDITYDDYNYPSIRISTTNHGSFDGNRRILLSAKSTFLISFLSTRNLTSSNYPMFTLNSGVNVTCSYSYSRIGATYYMVNIVITNNESSRQSVSFDYVEDVNFRVVPYYLGDVKYITDEMQMITQYFANNKPDYSSNFDNVVQLLENIGVDVSNLSIDNSELVTAIQNLNQAINDLNGQFNITNNIEINNIPTFSVNAYYWFGKFNNEGIVNDYYNYPNLYIKQTVTGSFADIRRLYVNAGRQLIIAIVSNVSLSTSNFPYYLSIPEASNSITVEYSVRSFSDRRYNYVVITNNYTSTVGISFDYTGTGIRVLPFYVGYVDLMTPEMKLITQFNNVQDPNLNALLSLVNVLTDNSVTLNDINATLELIQTSIGIDLNAMLNTFLADFEINIDKLLGLDIDVESLFDKLLEIDLDSLINFDVDIDLKLLSDLTLAIGNYLGQINDDVVNYHDIWTQQYDLLDLDTKLTVPQEIQSGANALGNMFEQIVASDGTIGFITYSSLSIGLFGLYLGLRREKK